MIMHQIAFSDCRIQHPKKHIGIVQKPISILQLIQEPLIGQERVNQFEIERLEFDSNLVLQQELIEEDVSEFPKQNYTIPQFEKSSEQKQSAYKQEFQKVKQLLIKLHYKEVLICLFVVSVFSSFIWCIIKLCILFRPQKHPDNEEEQKLLGADYSILNSKTISDDEQLNQSTQIKYKITDMTPQIRNPYDESFVKASIKATTRGSACDQSLLEIDELLQEMLK
ncbi:unnamed protein product (macronuclear) [Paramecium tetraurelia]|uniref:Transmembrane protein n=1 Tax=Paramecium tetraurelia TaxID=5888 RepID=A0EIC7_PARTE|nr:uncharacterized protein GSPATT00027397001 [Paramecium tetraurelia]CAK95068.1 unnamed protein product [Paramecium tetraurelia]|eukprot:XP_001462441.1 hypothetical protein (macronuclear) [Paramecium tetraurelia strain d4-2]